MVINYEIVYVLYIPWILRINLFKPTNPKDELVYISSWVRSMVYMVCKKNYMIDRSMTSKFLRSYVCYSMILTSYDLLFHGFAVICLLFHDIDVIRSVIPWFWRHRSVILICLLNLQNNYNHNYAKMFLLFWKSSN
jgi:hypothetical protein